MIQKWKVIIGCLCALLLNRLGLAAQVPVDDPYTTRYHKTGHWTEKLNWQNVVNVKEVNGLVDDKGNVDSLTLVNTMMALSKKGGVVYFPAGTYYFNYFVDVWDNVIIRGADPVIKEARDEHYRPPTKFEFPAYIPPARGGDTAVLSGFKRIRNGDSVHSNFGVVNVDINRALLNFSLNNSNVIVFGVRSNNAAKLYDFDWIDKKQIPQMIAAVEANINVRTVDNALIANCRTNDSITDDFENAHFMTNDGYVFKEPVKFQYASHCGIALMEERHSPGNTLEILDNYIISGDKYKVSFPYETTVYKGNETVESPIPNQNVVILWNDYYSQPLRDSIDKLFLTDTMIRPRKDFGNGWVDTLRYRLLKPKHYDPKKKYPLVLFFHASPDGGGGSLKHFVSTFARYQDEYPCFLIVPVLNHWNDPWTDQSGKLSNILELSMMAFEKIKKAYSIDNRNVCVIGLSSGGVAVASVLENRPNVFTKAFLLSSMFPIPDELQEKIRHIKFFVSAGTRDDVLPIGYTRYFVASLRKMNIQVKYYENDYNHCSWMKLAYTERENILKELFGK